MNEIIEKIDELLIDSVQKSCLSAASDLIEQMYKAASKLQRERDDLKQTNKINGILARQILWLAYVWNDHNCKDERFYIKGVCESVGINTFEEANDFIEKCDLDSIPEIQAKAVEDAVESLDDDCDDIARTIEELYAYAATLRNQAGGGQ